MPRITMPRIRNLARDCAYAIDLEEHGCLCDHPCHLYAGEPTDCNAFGCGDYRRRIRTGEMLARIDGAGNRPQERPKGKGERR